MGLKKWTSLGASHHLNPALEMVCEQHMKIRKIFSNRPLKLRKKTVIRQSVTQAEKSMSFWKVTSATDFATSKPKYYQLFSNESEEHCFLSES